MKKLLLGLCFCLVLTGLVCACENDALSMDGVTFDSGVYLSEYTHVGPDKNTWDDPGVASYQGDVIPDKKTAIAMATVILENTTPTSIIESKEPFHVFYDEEDEFWVVSFMQPIERINGHWVAVLGGECSIAMRKKDGQVLKIWFSE